jgi:hypothetical protein
MAHHFRRYAISTEKEKGISCYKITFVNEVTDVEITMQIPRSGVFDVPGSTRELTSEEVGKLAEHITIILDHDLHESNSPKGADASR